MQAGAELIGGKGGSGRDIVDLEKELSEKIGLKTKIEFNNEGSSGSITLYYSDLEQLDDIMRKLNK